VFQKSVGLEARWMEYLVLAVVGASLPVVGTIRSGARGGLAPRSAYARGDDSRGLNRTGMVGDSDE
jgi:hypothetical protein